MDGALFKLKLRLLVTLCLISFLISLLISNLLKTIFFIILTIQSLENVLVELWLGYKDTTSIASCGKFISVKFTIHFLLSGI